MPQITVVALQEVQAALERYRKEVEASNLKPLTKNTYTYHADTFVRWLADRFQPGVNIRE